MRHRELKVGMNIIGKPNNGYAVTNQYNICKVLKVNGLNEKIFVEVIEKYIYNVISNGKLKNYLKH